jgi:hypothetical protein
MNGSEGHCSFKVYYPRWTFIQLVEVPPLLHTFTIQRLSEAFKGIQSVLKIFQLDDTSKVTSTTKNACVCYSEIFFESREASSVQTSLNSYFKKHLRVRSSEKSPDSQSTNQPTKRLPKNHKVQIM